MNVKDRIIQQSFDLEMGPGLNVRFLASPVAEKSPSNQMNEWLKLGGDEGLSNVHLWVFGAAKCLGKRPRFMYLQFVPEHVMRPRAIHVFPS